MVKYVIPSFEILTPINRDEVLRRIELAGRTCYKSEDLITPESAAKFVKMIVGREHLSVIEHCIVTVKFIIPRGVSHEMVRHRIASYSQESTRYCNYSKTKFGNEITVIDQRPIIAEKFGIELIYGTETVAKTEKMIRVDDSGQRLISSLMNEENYVTLKTTKMLMDVWMTAMIDAEQRYLDLTKLGLSPEIARGVLPIDLKTEIVMTANLREWQYVFSKRCSPAAHPNMRQVMIPLHEEFRKVLPEIFGEVGSP